MKTTTNTTIEILDQVIDRYESLCEKYEIESHDRVSILMDLQSADEQFEMNWKRLLEADDLNAAHDIFGIIRNMDRAEYPGRVANCFLPRFSE